MRPQELTIYSEELGEFANSINSAINYLIHTMNDKDLSNGVITAKLKIEIVKVGTERSGIRRKLKIAPDVKVKAGMDNAWELEKKEDLYLSFDGDGTPIVAGRQIDIEEYLNGGLTNEQVDRYEEQRLA